jgi:hypothetical protein
MSLSTAPIMRGAQKVSIATEAIKIHRRAFFLIENLRSGVQISSLSQDWEWAQAQSRLSSIEMIVVAIASAHWRLSVVVLGVDEELRLPWLPCVQQAT